MHATAIVNGIKVAETDSYEVVDGNIYVWAPCYGSSLKLRPDFSLASSLRSS